MMMAAQAQHAALVAQQQKIQQLQQQQAAIERQIKQQMEQNLANIILSNPDQNDNKRFVLQACLSNPSELEHASDRLKDDKDVILASLRRGPENKAVQPHYGGYGQNANPRPPASLTKSPLAYASDRLCDDESVVRAALVQAAPSFKYASSRLQSDLSICIFAVSIFPGVYSLLSETMKIKPAVCSAVLRAMHVKRSSTYLKTSKTNFPFESVMKYKLGRVNYPTLPLPSCLLDPTIKTCEGTGFSKKTDGKTILDLFPKHLWGDPLFCEEAVLQIGAAIALVPEELRTNQMLFAAVKYNPNLLKVILDKNMIVPDTDTNSNAVFVSETKIEDSSSIKNIKVLEKLCLVALKKSPATVAFVPDVLWERRSFVKKAVSIHPGFILLASTEYLDDFEIAKIVVQQKYV